MKSKFKILTYFAAFFLVCWALLWMTVRVAAMAWKGYQ